MTKPNEKERMQQMFDTVTTALIKQGRPSMRDRSGGCAYRGDNGAACAVGHLITDKVYESIGYARLEGDGVRNETVLDALKQSLGRKLSEREVDLLVWLQGAHDEHVLVDGGIPVSHDKWLREFVNDCYKIAGVYSLSVAALHKARFNKLNEGASK